MRSFGSRLSSAVLADPVRSLRRLATENDARARARPKSQNFFASPSIGTATPRRVPFPLDARLSSPAANQRNPDRVGPEGGKVVPPRAWVGRLCERDHADGGQFVCRQRGDHQCVSSLSRGFSLWHLSAR